MKKRIKEIVIKELRYQIFFFPTPNNFVLVWLQLRTIFIIK